MGSFWRDHLPAVIVMAAGCTLMTGCSRQFLSLLVDLPPASARPAPVEVEETPTEGLQGTPLMLAPVDTARPPIESTLDPDSAVALLPRDVAGNIDWMAALASGVIKPRDFLPDSEPPIQLPQDFTFAFDFYFPGPSEQFDAYFPHSAHTEWVDCRQCHGRVFKYQDNQVTMAEILQGQWCGECHGKVAFPAVTGCERCHNSLPMPPGRAQPDLIGTITMQRFAANKADSTSAAVVTATPEPGPEPGAAAVDTTAVEAESGPPDSTTTEDAAGAAASTLAPPTLGYVAAELPPSQFPHWVHRIRYKCKTCHVQIFEPKAGANRVTMTDISNGEACGVCHDGVTAFAAGFNECQRCHIDPNAATTTGGFGSPALGTGNGSGNGSGGPRGSP